MNRTLPPFPALRAFEAAARHQSFTAAGDELHVTHGAISRQIAILERFVGVNVFDRHGKRVKLNDAGRLYLGVVREMFDNLSVATERLRDSGQTRVLRINALPTFAMRWLLPRLSQFQRAVPTVELRLSTSNLPVDQLEDLYRDHAHMTAAQWLRRVQARHAAKAITAGSPPEIAGADAGFSSRKVFEEAFVAEYAMLPSDYGNLNAKKGFALQLPTSYRPQEAVGYHGRDVQSPSERAEGQRIWKALHTADGPAIIEIAIGADRATVKVATEKNLGRESMAFLQQSALRMLGLSNDISAFEQRHPEIVKTRRGLRVPLLPSAFDALCWAITGQQINLTFAAALRRDMINLAGEKIYDMRVHPTAEQLANLGIEPLRKIRYSGSKANYMISAAEQIAGGHLDIEGLLDGSAVAAQDALVAQKGIGIWTARYVMMRTGFADAAPVGDSGLATALQRLYPSEARPDAEEAGRLMFRFSPHRSLASMHLWASLSDGK